MISNRFIPVRNKSDWLLVVSCACELVVLPVFFLVMAVHKLDT